MVRAKSNQELTFMRKAGIIVALAHRAASAAMRAGITTKEVNDIVEDVIRKNGGEPSFKGSGSYLHFYKFRCCTWYPR